MRPTRSMREVIVVTSTSLVEACVKLSVALAGCVVEKKTCHVFSFQQNNSAACNNHFAPNKRYNHIAEQKSGTVTQLGNVGELKKMKTLRLINSEEANTSLISVAFTATGLLLQYGET